MKILFASSGNTGFGIDPLIVNQGDSIINEGADLDYFTIKGKGFKGYFSNIPKLKKLIKENDYDIIHAHFVYTGWVAIFSAGKKPIVLSVMGSDAYGKYTNSGKRIFSSYFMMFLNQAIQPFVNVIIVKSNNINKYIYLKSKQHLVPNGVNFNRFKPKESIECRKNLGLPLDKKLVLFLADPGKSVKNFKLLEEASEKLDLNKIKIVNPYPIDNEEFPDYLNACDVFVLTSYNEGSPNVIKEAMACNIPIVSTNVGDVEEVISKTEGCYLTNYDPAILAAKIKMALQFGTRTNGREDIKHLESGVIARKIIDIYKSAISI